MTALNGHFLAANTLAIIRCLTEVWVWYCWLCHRAKGRSAFLPILISGGVSLSLESRRGWFAWNPLAHVSKPKIIAHTQRSAPPSLCTCETHGQRAAAQTTRQMSCIHVKIQLDYHYVKVYTPSTSWAVFNNTFTHFLHLAFLTTIIATLLPQLSRYIRFRPIPFLLSAFLLLNCLILLRYRFPQHLNTTIYTVP